MGGSPDLPFTNKSSRSVTGHASHLAVGTVQGFVASAISLPTGILTAAFLTRQLGPADYGLLTVAAAIVMWFQGAIVVGLSQSAVKFISEAEDWRNVTTKFLQAQFIVSLGASLLLFVAAPFFASWLDSAEMTLYLRVYSLNIPITSLSAIHQSAMVGRGQFRQQAMLPAVYWLSRLVLIFLFVSLYPSVTYVILASIGASIIVLCVARGFVRPDLLARSDFPIRNLWDYAWPLFFYTVGINLFTRMDLLFVKALGDTPQSAGYYGAAMNLTIVPALFAMAFSPLLLAKLSQLRSKQCGEDEKILAKLAMRVVICLLPFAGMSSGAASEIVTAIYGETFLSAASYFSLLIFAALGLAMISVTSSIFIAAGRPGLPLSIVGPFVVIAPFAHYLFVNWLGPIGAAIVTLCLAWLGASAALMAVYRIRHIPSPVMTLLRSLLISALSYTIALLWPSPGVLLLIKLPVIGTVIVLSFLMSGEFSRREIDFGYAMIWRNKNAESPGSEKTS